MKKKNKAFAILIFLAVAAGIAAVVMLLWNAVVPAVIGWAAVTYWQALGLLVLCRILFGGFGKRMGHFMHKHPGHKHFHEKLKQMSHEERREFIRQRMGADMPPFHYAHREGPADRDFFGKDDAHNTPHNHHERPE